MEYQIYPYTKSTFESTFGCSHIAIVLSHYILISFQLFNLAIFPLRDELLEKACSKKAIKLGYSSKHIRIRIKEEYILLKRYALLLFGYFLALIYPYPIVMRNFSFYLHHTMKDYVEDESTLRHKTLYDLGHQAIYIFFSSKIFINQTT